MVPFGAEVSAGEMVMEANSSGTVMAEQPLICVELGGFAHTSVWPTPRAVPSPCDPGVLLTLITVGVEVQSA